MSPPGIDLNTLPLPELYRSLAATGLVRRVIELARDEDLGAAESPWHGRVRPDAQHSWGGDITTAACVDLSRTGRASMVMRSAGVVAGLEAMGDLLDVFAPGCTFEAALSDGQPVTPGTVLGVLSGPLDEVLELERTMLNLVSRLSGVATRTSEFVTAMLGGRPAPEVKAKLYDTRKTTPGLRVLEKYAVRCGGGFCHRMGLYDAVLIKDNHIAGVRPADLGPLVQQAAAKARQLSGHFPPAFIEVEVDTLDQLQSLLVLPRGVLDIILLDNMGVPQLKEAVALRDKFNPAVQLEASGGINLATIHQVALTGIDRIAVGALTHAAISLDIGLDISS